METYLAYKKSNNGPSTHNGRDSRSHSMQAHSIAAVIPTSSDSTPQNNLTPSQIQQLLSLISIGNEQPVADFAGTFRCFLF